MINRYKTTYFLIALAAIALLLCSCDAMLMMPYEVKNKTSNTIRLKINDYPEHAGIYFKGKDTIISLKPKESVIVGWNNGIGFPWETKKLYREMPGVQNFSLVSSDSTLINPTSKKYWKYRHGVSRFTIKKNRISGIKMK